MGCPRLASVICRIILAISASGYFAGFAANGVAGEFPQSGVPSEWSPVEKSRNDGCINLGGHYEHRGERAPSNTEKMRLSTLANFLHNRLEIIKRADIDSVVLRQDARRELRVDYYAGTQQVKTQVIGGNAGDFECFEDRVVITRGYEVGGSEHFSRAKGTIRLELFRSVDGALIMQHSYTGTRTDLWLFSSMESTVNWYRFLGR